MKVVFILGSGHCGSTLLDIILGSHSNIFGAGELEHLLTTKDKCACGEQKEQCIFWQKIIKEIKLDDLRISRNKKNFVFGRDEYFYRAKGNGKKVEIKKYIEENEKLYQAIETMAGKKIVIDSSKNPDRVDILSHSTEIEPIVIQLVRDGRAVTWSYMKKYNRAFVYMFKWLAANVKIEILKRRSKIKSIFVSYRDLTTDPEKVIRRITKELGVDFEFSMLDLAQGERHQVGGNRMKFVGDSRIREDNEWQEKMPRFSRLLFTSLFGWLNYYYKRYAKRF